MKKIAITGNIASGKSLAQKIIEELGFPVIDCDIIVKSLYSQKNIIDKLKIKFPEIITENNVDLKKISVMLFSDNKIKKKFEDFIYPYVLSEINNFFDKNAENEVAFVVVPQLYEAELEKYFDKVILITADDKIRRERLKNRKSIMSNWVEKAMSAQIPQEEKIGKSDYIIQNNGSVEEYEISLKNVLKSI